MNILIAPINSLYSPKFYREVFKGKLRQGFAYLAFFSVVAAFLFVVLFKAFAMPQVEEFIQWMKSSMPQLTLADNGLNMTIPSPYQMEHPKWGKVALFDMTKSEIEPRDMKDALLMVTSGKIFLRTSSGVQTIADLKTLRGKQRIGNAQIDVNAQLLDKFFGVIRPVILTVAFGLFYAVFFIWKIIEGLLASLVGLVANHFRKQKLSYRGILNASFFSVTLSSCIWFVKIAIPTITDKMPFGIWSGVLITAIFLFFMIKMGEERV